MKNIFTSSVLSLLILTSCTTRVVSAEKPYSDDKISVGKTYTFITNNHKKEPLNVTKIDSEKIYGKDYNGKEVSIEKSELLEIKKNKTLATIGIAAGVVLLALFIPAYVKNKPVGQ